MYIFQLTEIDELRERLQTKDGLLKQYEAQIEQLQLSINRYRNDRKDRDRTSINTIQSEESKGDDNDNTLNDKYWKFKIESVRKSDLERNELNEFKAMIISQLQPMRDEFDKKESRIQKKFC